MGYLISHNHLGHEIVRAYDDQAADGEILDSEELALLREYIADPSPNGTQTFLQTYGFTDAPSTKPGSLVGYVVAKGGFSTSEISTLTKFFARSDVSAHLEGVIPRKVSKEERAL
ncbi:hypothetical protein FKW77_007307 [Venturia effusa]|uniref:Uncharacterized protein n=1 Tax=Venturia effusa TaxID=50376 RepID=A0A517L5P9_9PEZI|nr:hypothetical protein FKW77_007307 [Venturia effusa]